MSDSAYQNFAAEYSAIFTLLYQQLKSKLFRTVTIGKQSGIDSYEDFIGVFEGQEKSGQHVDTPLDNPAHTRRRLSLVTWHDGVLLDREDRINMMKDPTDAYTVGLSAGAGRWNDQKILRALGGIAYTGVQGGTSVNNYASGECRLVSGDGALVTAGSNFSDTTATNLTLAKLKTCKLLLDEASVPEEDRFFVTSATNWAALVLDTTLDGSERQAIVNINEGRMTGKVMGFEPISLPTSLFVVDPTETDCINSYAYHRSAIRENVANGGPVSSDGLPQDAQSDENGMFIRVAERPDKSHAKQIYVATTNSFSRMQGPGVVEINLKTL
jgi:hypothetical protein